MKIQYGETFSLDTDECNDDTLHIGVRGFGVLQIEVNLQELAVRLLKPDSGSVEPVVEFTAPHEVFGDGRPTMTDRREHTKTVLNKYVCVCGHKWADLWDCGCNDRCPKCNKEIEPTSSEEITV